MKSISSALIYQSIKNLYPIQGWLYVGAGDGSVLNDLPMHSIPALLAIEAGKRSFDRLKKSAQIYENCQVLHLLVNDEDGEADYYSYFNSSESGLIPEDKLLSIWKKLSMREQFSLPTRRLASIIDDEGKDFSFNWLTIDCLPAVPLLKGLKNHLEMFDFIQLRVSFDNEILENLGAGFIMSENFLKSHGFKCIHIEKENNVKLGSVIYVRDWKSLLLKDKSDLILSLEIEKSRLISSLEEDKKNMTSFFNLEKKLLRNSVKESNDISSGLMDEIVSLKKLNSDLLEFKQIALLQQKESKVNSENSDKVFQGLNLLNSKLENQIKIEITNAAKQIGDFLSLNSYLHTGVMAPVDLETNGWPASSDFMLYLVRLIEERKYDLIIEFGSGTSTLAIAKTIKHIAHKHGGIHRPSFISFDHLEKYFSKTGIRLKSSGLNQHAELLLAPLNSYIASDKTRYQFYDCSEILLQFKQKQNSRLSVLVVVDGPPATTVKYARYPAGPIIAKIFADDEIDFLLDDASRQDEKVIAEKWTAEFLALNYSVTEELIDTEKGAFLLQAKRK